MWYFVKHRLWHLRKLLSSPDFWKEYLFYVWYIALLWFVVQVILLHVSLRDYFMVFALQICSIFGSAIVFVGLKNHYQPSNYWTKVWYFILANGPWLGIIYHIVHHMETKDVLIYAGCMFVVTMIEWALYDYIFDYCCDYAHRLKTLYRRRKNR